MTGGLCRPHYRVWWEGGVTERAAQARRVRRERAAALAVLVMGAEVRDRVDAVRSAREVGCTWAQIGQALGVTAQAVHEQYARRLAGGRDNTAAGGGGC